MEKKRQKPGALSRAAEMFDLPQDLVAGLPYMEFLGDREFLMDRHQGILSYSEETVDINAGKLVVRLQGSGLKLLSMTEEVLRLGGEIRSMELMR